MFPLWAHAYASRMMTHINCTTVDTADDLQKSLKLEMEDQDHPIYIIDGNDVYDLLSLDDYSETNFNIDNYDKLDYTTEQLGCMLFNMDEVGLKIELYFADRTDRYVYENEKYYTNNEATDKETWFATVFDFTAIHEIEDTTDHDPKEVDMDTIINLRWATRTQICHIKDGSVNVKYGTTILVPPFDPWLNNFAAFYQRYEFKGNRNEDKMREDYRSYDTRTQKLIIGIKTFKDIVDQGDLYTHEDTLIEAINRTDYDKARSIIWETEGEEVSEDAIIALIGKEPGQANRALVELMLLYNDDLTIVIDAIINSRRNDLISMIEEKMREFPSGFYEQDINEALETAAANNYNATVKELLKKFKFPTEFLKRITNGVITKELERRKKRTDNPVVANSLRFLIGLPPAAVPEPDPESEPESEPTDEEIKAEIAAFLENETYSREIRRGVVKHIVNKFDSANITRRHVKELVHEYLDERFPCNIPEATWQVEVDALLDDNRKAPWSVIHHRLEDTFHCRISTTMKADIMTYMNTDYVDPGDADVWSDLEELFEEQEQELINSKLKIGKTYNKYLQANPNASEQEFIKFLEETMEGNLDEDAKKVAIDKWNESRENYRARGVQEDAEADENQKKLVEALDPQSGILQIQCMNAKDIGGYRKYSKRNNITQIQSDEKTYFIRADNEFDTVLVMSATEKKWKAPENSNPNNAYFEDNKIKFGDGVCEVSGTFEAAEPVHVADWDFKIGSEKGFKPEDYQMHTLKYGGRKLLMAHRPGFGKTINALLHAERLRNSYPDPKPFIAILAPTRDLVLHWVREMDKMKLEKDHYFWATYNHFVASEKRYVSHDGLSYPEWDHVSIEQKKKLAELKNRWDGKSPLPDDRPDKKPRWQNHCMVCDKSVDLFEPKWGEGAENALRISERKLHARGEILDWVPDETEWDPTAIEEMKRIWYFRSWNASKHTIYKSADKKIVIELSWRMLEDKIFFCCPECGNGQGQFYTGFQCIDINHPTDFERFKRDLSSNTEYTFKRNRSFKPKFGDEKKWTETSTRKFLSMDTDTYVDEERKKYADFKKKLETFAKMTGTVLEIKKHLRDTCEMKKETSETIPYMVQNGRLWNMVRFPKNCILICDEIHTKVKSNKVHITSALWKYCLQSDCSILCTATPVESKNELDQVYILSELLREGKEREYKDKVITPWHWLRKWSAPREKTIFELCAPFKDKISRHNTVENIQNSVDELFREVRKEEIKRYEINPSAVMNMYMGLKGYARYEELNTEKQSTWMPAITGLKFLQLTTTTDGEFMKELLKNLFQLKQQIGRAKQFPDKVACMHMEFNSRGTVNDKKVKKQDGYTEVQLDERRSRLEVKKPVLEPRYYLTENGTYDLKTIGSSIRVDDGSEYSMDEVKALQQAIFESMEGLVSIAWGNDDPKSAVRALYSSLGDANTNINRGKEILKMLTPTQNKGLKWLKMPTIMEDTKAGPRRETRYDDCPYIPGALSSKVTAIVKTIERAVLEGKNVMVYHDKIELLRAVQRGLAMRKHKSANEMVIKDDDLKDHQEMTALRRWSLLDEVYDDKTRREVIEEQQKEYNLFVGKESNEIEEMLNKEFNKQAATKLWEFLKPHFYKATFQGNYRKKGKINRKIFAKEKRFDRLRLFNEYAMYAEWEDGKPDGTLYERGNRLVEMTELAFKMKGSVVRANPEKYKKLFSEYKDLFEQFKKCRVFPFCAKIIDNSICKVLYKERKNGQLKYSIPSRLLRTHVGDLFDYKTPNDEFTDSDDPELELEGLNDLFDKLGRNIRPGSTVKIKGTDYKVKSRKGRYYTLKGESIVDVIHLEKDRPTFRNTMPDLPFDEINKELAKYKRFFQNDFFKPETITMDRWKRASSSANPEQTKDVYKEHSDTMVTDQTYSTKFGLLQVESLSQTGEFTLEVKTNDDFILLMKYIKLFFKHTMEQVYTYNKCFMRDIWDGTEGTHMKADGSIEEVLGSAPTYNSIDVQKHITDRLDAYNRVPDEIKDAYKGKGKMTILTNSLYEYDGEKRRELEGRDIDYFIRETDSDNVVDARSFCNDVSFRLDGLDDEKTLFYAVLTGNVSSKEKFVSAFSEGKIDCLFVNDSGIEGVDYKSPCPSLMICIDPVKMPGKQDQFIGRTIRRNSHKTLPDKLKTTEYVSFYTVPMQSDEIREQGDKDETNASITHLRGKQLALKTKLKVKFAENNEYEAIVKVKWEDVTPSEEYMKIQEELKKVEEIINTTPDNSEEINDLREKIAASNGTEQRSLGRALRKLEAERETKVHKKAKEDRSDLEKLRKEQKKADTDAYRKVNGWSDGEMNTEQKREFQIFLNGYRRYVSLQESIDAEVLRKKNEDERNNAVEARDKALNTDDLEAYNAAEKTIHELDGETWVNLTTGEFNLLLDGNHPRGWSPRRLISKLLDLETEYWNNRNDVLLDRLYDGTDYGINEILMFLRKADPKRYQKIPHDGFTATMYFDGGMRSFENILSGPTELDKDDEATYAISDMLANIDTYVNLSYYPTKNNYSFLSIKEYELYNRKIEERKEAIQRDISGYWEIKDKIKSLEADIALKSPRERRTLMSDLNKEKEKIKPRDDPEANRKLQQIPIDGYFCHICTYKSSCRYLDGYDGLIEFKTFDSPDKTTIETAQEEIETNETRTSELKKNYGTVSSKARPNLKKYVDDKSLTHLQNLRNYVSELEQTKQTIEVHQKIMRAVLVTDKDVMRSLATWKEQLKFTEDKLKDLNDVIKKEETCDRCFSKLTKNHQPIYYHMMPVLGELAKDGGGIDGLRNDGKKKDTAERRRCQRDRLELALTLNSIEHTAVQSGPKIHEITVGDMTLYQGVRNDEIEDNKLDWNELFNGDGDIPDYSSREPSGLETNLERTWKLNMNNIGTSPRRLGETNYEEDTEEPDDVVKEQYKTAVAEMNQNTIDKLERDYPKWDFVKDKVNSVSESEGSEASSGEESSDEDQTAQIPPIRPLSPYELPVQIYPDDSTDDVPSQDESDSTGSQGTVEILSQSQAEKSTFKNFFDQYKEGKVELDTLVEIRQEFTHVAKGKQHYPQDVIMMITGQLVMEGESPYKIANTLNCSFGFDGDKIGYLKDIDIDEINDEVPSTVLDNDIKQILLRKGRNKGEPFVPMWALWLDISQDQQALLEQIRNAGDNIDKRNFNQLLVQTFTTEQKELYQKANDYIQQNSERNLRGKKVRDYFLYSTIVDEGDGNSSIYKEKSAIGNQKINGNEYEPVAYLFKSGDTASGHWTILMKTGKWWYVNDANVTESQKGYNPQATCRYVLYKQQGVEQKVFKPVGLIRATGWTVNNCWMNVGLQVMVMITDADWNHCDGYDSSVSIESEY